MSASPLFGIYIVKLFIGFEIMFIWLQPFWRREWVLFVWCLFLSFSLEHLERVLEWNSVHI